MEAVQAGAEQKSQALRVELAHAATDPRGAPRGARTQERTAPQAVARRRAPLVLVRKVRETGCATEPTRCERFSLRAERAAGGEQHEDSIALGCPPEAPQLRAVQLWRCASLRGLERTQRASRDALEQTAPRDVLECLRSAVRSRSCDPRCGSCFLSFRLVAVLWVCVEVLLERCPQYVGLCDACSSAQLCNLLVMLL